MKPGQTTLILFLALALIAGSVAPSDAGGRRSAPPSNLSGHTAVQTQPIADRGCLLAFSSIGVDAVGTNRDIMLAWSQITGSVRRNSATPRVTMNGDCPTFGEAAQFEKGDAPSPAPSSTTFDLAAHGLEIGLRYHFGPNGPR